MSQSTTEMSARTASDLLCRAGRGNRRAFEWFFDLSSPRVLGVALRLTANQDDAEELLEKIFLDAWRLAPQFDPSQGAAEAWITHLLVHHGLLFAQAHELGVSEAVARLTRGLNKSP